MVDYCVLVDEDFVDFVVDLLKEGCDVIDFCFELVGVYWFCLCYFVFCFMCIGVCIWFGMGCVELV